MKLKMNRQYIIAAVFAFLALLLIILLKTVDVTTFTPIDVETGAANQTGLSTDIGFSKVNLAVQSAIGYKAGWYKVTTVVGYLSIVIGLIGIGLAAVQFLMRKDLMKVDKCLFAYTGLIVVMAILYVFFDKVIVNCRPVVFKGEGLEASFPSSHTMLSCTIMGGVLLTCKRYLKNFPPLALLITRAVCLLIVVIMVVGRMLSGVHWLTDIIGGVLISGAMLSAYAGVLENLRAEEKRKKKHRTAARA